MLIPAGAGSPVGARGLLWGHAGRSGSYSIFPAHPPTRCHTAYPSPPSPKQTGSHQLSQFVTRAPGGTAQTHLSHWEHFVPPLSQEGCNRFKFMCKLTPFPLSLSAFLSHLSSKCFSLWLASPRGFFSPSHPSPHLREPKLVTGWGRSCSSPWCVQSPTEPHLTPCPSILVTIIPDTRSKCPFGSDLVTCSSAFIPPLLPAY